MASSLSCKQISYRRASPDLLGAEEPQLTPKRLGDLIVRIIVEDHRPAVLAAGDPEFGHIDRVDPTVILDLGGIRQRVALDRVLAALPARPGEGKLRESLGHGRPLLEMSIDDPNPGQRRAVLATRSRRRRGTGALPVMARNPRGSGA